MYVTCLDLEGVLVPEIWIAFAEASGIPELKRTTRDEPDYDKLMAFRLGLLKERGLGLREIQAKHKVIGDVRGLGSMVAIELFEGGDTHKPAAELVSKIVVRAREKGLILLSCGTYYNVIRFLMPVTIPDAQLEKGLAILAECFDELA